MKRNVIRGLAPVALIVALGAARAVAAESPSTEAGTAFGQEGKALPGGVQKYSWPRRDLHVTVGDVPVAPGFGLGSWAAFKASENEAMTMGDLVLLETEVNPVIRELQAGGFEILAVHNHLLGESPHVIYVHFMGRGAQAVLAQTLKAALGKTKTPTASAPASKPSAEQTKLFDELQSALGQKGTMAGTVLQISVARADAIKDGGMEIPASMGMAESINFETVGTRVATTGDFVLSADEVNPVIRELEAHGIEVTALHSHMLRESPRLFFMHFWGVGTPEKIGEGLKAALGKVAVK
jgi:biotin operon repressor